MEDKTPLTAEWKLIPHSSQIADTGDYTGYYEITNGKASFESDLDDDEDLQNLIDFLNRNDYQLSTWRGKEEADFAWSQVKQLHEQTASLQERVWQLEEERKDLLMKIAQHKGANLRLSQNFADSKRVFASESNDWKAEKETLMGELRRYVTRYADDVEQAEVWWQSFCKEKGISPSPPEAL